MEVESVGNYFNALYQGIPIGGYTNLVERMLDAIEVRLNVDYLAHRQELDALAETVIYTGPIVRAAGISFFAF